MDEENNDIHARMRALRAALGLTTRTFGSAISMTGGAVTNMEKGRRDITARTIRDICREYGVSQEWLVSGTGSMFDDALEGMELPDDVRELASLYTRLSVGDKELVKALIASLAEKGE